MTLGVGLATAHSTQHDGQPPAQHSFQLSAACTSMRHNGTAAWTIRSMPADLADVCVPPVLVVGEHRHLQQEALEVGPAVVEGTERPQHCLQILEQANAHAELVALSASTVEQRPCTQKPTAAHSGLSSGGSGTTTQPWGSCRSMHRTCRGQQASATVTPCLCWRQQ